METIRCSSGVAIAVPLCSHPNSVVCPTYIRPLPCLSANGKICSLQIRSSCRRVRTVPCRASFSAGSSGGLTPELKQSLDKFVREHKIVLFMKGTKVFPQCGFSNTVIQILNSLNVPYETVNILEDDGLRQGLKEYSNWPTFPQLYVDGEFYGGCDIALQAYQSGELKEAVEKAMCS